MKKFEGIKNGVNLAALALALALFAAAGFFSCDNMSGGGSDPAPQAVPTQTAPTSAPTATPASGEKTYVIFRGSVGVGGALPQEVSANVAALEDSIAAGDGDLQLVSKSAEPSLNVNGTDYYYYVIATPQDSANSPIEYGKSDNTKFNPGENGVCYELTLGLGKWKIECGIKNAAGTPVLRDITDVIELTATDPIINKSFVAAPASDAGNGSVLLYIDQGDATTIASATASWKDAGGTEHSEPLTVASESAGDPATTEGKLKLKLDSVAPGAYEMAISFYNTTNPNAAGAVMVYQTVQTVNVLGGMKTDTWANGGGTDGNLITGSGSAAAFKITTAAVDLFKSTYLYVGATGATGAKAPNDANEGSAYAPFEHLQKAFDTIAATGSDSADYRIFIRGTVEGNATLGSGLDAKASSIQIANVDGESGAVIEGGRKTADLTSVPLNVLTVATTVPITIKGVKITKKSSADYSRGICINDTNANVTLLDGTEISGNKSGADFNGGGVYIQNGTLCMKGGVIKGNTAKQGGAVYVNSGSGITANLKISGSAKIPCGTDGKNDVYLAEKSDNTYPAIQIAGALVSGATADTDKIAVTAANWRRKKIVVQADSHSSLADISAYENYFKPTGKGINFTFKGTVANLSAPYYVAQNGVDDVSTPGTKDAPYGSIKFACSQLSGGDKETIYVNGTLAASDASSLQIVPTDLDGGATFDTTKCAALTIEGDSADSAIDGGNFGSALTVDTAVPVTIKNLKITKGIGTTISGLDEGGGLYVKSGKVTLSDGAAITGNHATNGGGAFVCDGATLIMNSTSQIFGNYAVENSKGGGAGGALFLNSGAKFFMHGSAIIGKALATGKTAQNLDQDSASNYSRMGGAIGGSGNIYLGYASCDNSGEPQEPTNLTGGVIGNYSRGTGGGIWVGGKVYMASGKISDNKGASSGGGVYLSDSGQMSLAGGSVLQNAAANGGGIYIDYMTSPISREGTFAASAGEIKGNVATSDGGAVYNNMANFKMRGTASIPCDGEKKNDVYLAGGSTIQLTHAIDASVTTAAKITVPSGDWTRGKQVLSESSGGIVAGSAGKFATTDDDFKVQTKTGDTSQGVLYAPIIVAQPATPIPAAQQRGTNSKPYSTVQSAVDALNSENDTITVVGTVTGHQTISSPSKSFTLEGEASGTLNGGGSGSPGTTLKVNAGDKTITITNLKVTGGYVNVAANTSGGGINLISGTVCLASGAQVTGNYSFGWAGGVAVNGGATLCMYGNAVVGNNNGSLPADIENDSGIATALAAGANVSTIGAGIHVELNGKAYLGYTGADVVATGTNKWTGGVCGNYAYKSSEVPAGIAGGELSGGKGGGLHNDSGLLKIADGNVSYNKAQLCCGGVWSDCGNEAGQGLFISGGTIKGNFSAAAAGQGTGCGVESVGLFEMTGGTIKENSFKNDNKGGGVYASGTFKMSGTASIPYDSSTGLKGNCVYLNGVDSQGAITVDSDFASTAPQTVAWIQPVQWRRGATVLKGDKAGANVGKFKTIDEEFSVISNDSCGKLDADFWVAGTSPAVSGGSAGDDTNGRGTKKKPYATIQKAASQTWKAAETTINVSGTLTATSDGTGEGKGNLQNIPASGVTATSIKLAGTSSATINGGGKGSALTVNGNDVTITNIKITGGSAANGAGINVAAGTVKLGDGATVTGNVASANGGGVYVGSSGKLFIYGKALIGDSSTSTTIAADGTSPGSTTFANKAALGGGIYNDGALYIGYSGMSGSNPVASPIDVTANSTQGYGIRRNLAESGAGIYQNSAAEVKVASGKISFNRATESGGAIYIATSEKVNFVSGSTAAMDSNRAATSGGAVYIAGTLTIFGGTGYNNEAAQGGAIYHAGELNFFKDANFYSATNAVGKNDIYISGNKTIWLSGKVNGEYAATLTFEDGKWTRGRTILSSANASYTADSAGKFKTTDSDFTVVQKDSTSSGVLKADIYVAGASSRYHCLSTATPSDAATTRGTASNPFASIKGAMYAVNANATTITVDGALSAAQTIDGKKSDGNAIPAAVTAITVKGYKKSSTDTSVAKLDGASAANTTMLTVNASGLAVTIQDLTITGGNNATGGGINLAAGTVNLDSGAKVTANKAASGGKGAGVYVASGATLNIKTGSVISSNIAASGNIEGGGVYNAGTVNLQGGSLHKNAANYGGGIYNKGALSITSGTIGGSTNANSAADSGGGIYSDVDATSFAMSGGTVSYNTITGTHTSFQHGGGGLYIASAGSITGGTIQNNNATNSYGGGIYCGSSDGLAISGGTISSNSAKYGGGVYHECGLAVSGGTFSGNTAGTGGGAIYAYGTFNVSGDALIYTASDAVKTNDVYLDGTEKPTIYIASTPNKTTVASITLPDYKRGTNILSAPKTGVTLNATLYSKFKLTKDDAGWNRDSKTGTDYKFVYITSPIYVVGTSASSSSRPDATWGYGQTTGANGTKTSPYATIEAALGCSDLSYTSNTITVAGTLKGAQTTGASVSASSVTIKGYDTSAAINGNASGSALTIASAKTFTIQQLQITNGKADAGGGINITAAATVNLDSGAKVYSNKATSGGTGAGVYVKSGATLYIKDGSAIYSNAAYSGDINGAGVYNAGTVSMSGGSVFSNTAKQGGGIYNAGALTMSGGTIGGSDANKNKAVTGGGVYNYSSKTFTLSGGAISYNLAENSADNGSAEGGGIYNSGYLNITGAASISYNTAKETSTGKCYASGGGIYSNYNLAISGGMTMGGNKTDVPYTTSSFSKSRGGAIYNGNTFTMSAGTIGDVSAPNIAAGNSGAVLGGGIYIINSSLTMSGGTIGDGSKEASASSSSGSFANKAEYGGGIYADTSSSFTINKSSCKVNYNYASENGGGIYWNGSTLNATNGNISYNASGAGGGGIYFAADASVYQAAFIKNKSSSSGGAFYIPEGVKVTLSGPSTFTSNTAADYGGAVKIYKGTLEIKGAATFTKNSATSSWGGAVYVERGTFTMSAGTIGGSSSSDANTAGGNGGAVGVYAGSTFTMSGSAYIPYGDSVKSNDVFLQGGANLTIGLGSSLTNHASTNQVGVTLGASPWTTGTKVLSGGTESDAYAYTKLHYQKFMLTNSSGYYIDEYGQFTAGYFVTAANLAQTILNLPSSTSRLNVVCSSGSISDWSSIQSALKSTSASKVLLDLSKSSITSVPAKAFQGCTKLYQCYLSDDVTSIGDYAFDGCTNIIGIQKSGAFYGVNGVKTVGKYAFRNCGSLTSSNFALFGVTTFYTNSFEGVNITDLGVTGSGQTNSKFNVYNGTSYSTYVTTTSASYDFNLPAMRTNYPDHKFTRGY
ncbi:MAG: leucine-rich repeat protein [Treponema sp.]|nr:leucine-rich repeat protein [Treponema sp.]